MAAPPAARAERASRATAGIGLAVGVAAAVSPRAMLRLYGVRPEEVTGTATLGWRLFGMRNLMISPPALRGDARMRSAFLPTQLLDQLAFAAALRSGRVPRRAALGAMATSGAIIALELMAERDRRRARATA